MREAGGSLRCRADLGNVAEHSSQAPRASTGRVSSSTPISSDTKRNIVQDRGEEIVEVVRDATGELTEALEPVGLVQSRLQKVARSWTVARSCSRRVTVRSLASRIAAETSGPSLVSIAEREISTGNSEPSFRRPSRRNPKTPAVRTPDPGFAQIRLRAAISCEGGSTSISMEWSMSSVLRVPEQCLGFGIDERNPSARDQRRRLRPQIPRARRETLRQSRLRSLMSRGASDDDGLAAHLRPRQHDLSSKFGPILTASDQLCRGVVRPIARWSLAAGILWLGKRVRGTSAASESRAAESISASRLVAEECVWLRRWRTRSHCRHRCRGSRRGRRREAGRLQVDDGVALDHFGATSRPSRIAITTASSLECAPNFSITRCV